ncbi:MAG: hypothetical protein ACUVRV_00605 [Cyanobacteriota bacterium]
MGKRKRRAISRTILGVKHAHSLLWHGSAFALRATRRVNAPAAQQR